MSKRLFFFPALLAGLSLCAQNDEALARRLADEFFAAYGSGDTSALREMLCEEAQLGGVDLTVPGGEHFQSQPASVLLQAAIRLKEMNWKEEYEIREVLRSPHILEAAGPYVFYLNGEAHHKGWNHFTWVELNGRWRLARLMDSSMTP